MLRSYICSRLTNASTTPFDNVQSLTQRAAILVFRDPTILHATKAAESMKRTNESVAEATDAQQRSALLEIGRQGQIQQRILPIDS